MRYVPFGTRVEFQRMEIVLELLLASSVPPISISELREAIARVLGAREQAGAIPLITRYSLQDARDPADVLSV
jgi:hypothetical protein